MGSNLPDGVRRIAGEVPDLSMSVDVQTFDDLVGAIEESTRRARNAAARHVCADQLLAYWNNGRLIVEYEQGGRDRAKYGDKTLLRLSRKLTREMGRGFSRSNLQYMRLLYIKHPNCQTLSGKFVDRAAWSLADDVRSARGQTSSGTSKEQGDYARARSESLRPLLRFPSDDPLGDM